MDSLQISEVAREMRDFQQELGQEKTSTKSKMPPRIPLPPRLGVSTLCFRPASIPSKGPQYLSFANVASLAHTLKRKDPYAVAQAKQRKTANLTRQEVLRKERTEALGDPVRGISTPFLESFDDVGGSVPSGITPNNSPKDGTAQDTFLNHFLKPSELQDSLEHSKILTEPVINKVRDGVDPTREIEMLQKYLDGHARATEALTRITSLANAGQKDKTRANISRCIETFGRHNTDRKLRPRAPVNPAVYGGKDPLPEKTGRAGPDTGSSEVQIAILTAKIRVMANQLETRGGSKDKINKRNLRVLVHKRQKLLKYLRIKERGSDRWENLTQTLGLTEGTWKGEISL